MILMPAEGEYAPYYGTYINKVSPSGPVTVLEAQRTAFEALRDLPEDKATFRYAEGKWSVKEVLGHLADSERVFGYRLLRAARADATPLPGFDENKWAQSAPHHHRSMDAIVSELLAIRGATLALIGSLDHEALGRSVEANGKPVSARALCWILAGHTEHHLGVLKERYGV
jgi:uncharacterized damage-inducible protein DinB